MSKAMNVIGGLMFLAGVTVFGLKYSSMHEHADTQITKVMTENKLTVVKNNGYVSISDPKNICDKSEDTNTSLVVTNEANVVSNVLLCSNIFGQFSIRVLP